MRVSHALHPSHPPPPIPYLRAACTRVCVRMRMRPPHSTHVVVRPPHLRTCVRPHTSCVCVCASTTPHVCACVCVCACVSPSHLTCVCVRVHHTSRACVCESTTPHVCVCVCVCVAPTPYLRDGERGCLRWPGSHRERHPAAEEGHGHAHDTACPLSQNPPLNFPLNSPDACCIDWHREKQLLAAVTQHSDWDSAATQPSDWDSDVSRYTMLRLEL